MRRVGLRSVVLILGLLLAGCASSASSETRSLVSAHDIPASKYTRIAVFIENLDDTERTGAEQILVSAFRNVGVNAVSGSDVFKGSGKLSDEEKAKVVQSEFDAVLYFRVLENGIFEKRVENAYFDGQLIQHKYGFLTLGHAPFWHDVYDVKPDGSVYEPMLALKAKVDIQDTKSAKEIWTSETVSTGNAKTTKLTNLIRQISDQIVTKMQKADVI